MIPRVLARQPQTGIENHYRTTFPFANEPYVAAGRGSSGLLRCWQ